MSDSTRFDEGFCVGDAGRADDGKYSEDLQSDNWPLSTEYRVKH